MEGPTFGTRLIHQGKFQEAQPPAIVGILDETFTLLKLIFKWGKTENKHIHICGEDVQLSKGIEGQRSSHIIMAEEVRESFPEEDI